jgi:hypothetical protein
MIKDSLIEFGAARSIVIDEGDAILAGNGTVLAAEQAGIKTVRVIEAEGDEVIAVRRTNLTPEQKRRLALFDNRSSELAEWDKNILATLSEEIDLSDLWDDEELSAMLHADGGADPGGSASPFSDEGQTFASKYGVIVECGSEGEQESVFRDLQGMGYKCRVVVV